METLSDGGGVIDLGSDIVTPEGYALVASYYFNDFFSVPDGTTVKTLTVDFVSMLQIDPDAFYQWMAFVPDLFGQFGQDVLAWTLSVSPESDVTIPTDFTFAPLGWDIPLPLGGQTIASMEGYHLVIWYQQQASGLARGQSLIDYMMADYDFMAAIVFAILLLGGWGLVSALFAATTVGAIVALADGITALQSGQYTFTLPTLPTAPNVSTAPVSPGPLRPAISPYDPCASSDVGTSGCSGRTSGGSTGGNPGPETNAVMIGLAAVAAGALVAIAASSGKRGV